MFRWNLSQAEKNKFAMNKNGLAPYSLDKIYYPAGVPSFFSRVTNSALDPIPTTRTTLKKLARSLVSSYYTTVNVPEEFKEDLIAN